MFLVYMDIKFSNIFIFWILILNVVFEEGDEDDWVFNKVIFKIGDFGYVIRIFSL